MNNKKNTKSFVISLAMAVLLLTTSNLNAQIDGRRGMFGGGAASERMQQSRGMLNVPANSVDGISNYGIGEDEEPLGSGIAFLLAAGLGYAALKRKEDKR